MTCTFNLSNSQSAFNLSNSQSELITTGTAFRVNMFEVLTWSYEPDMSTGKPIDYSSVLIRETEF